MKPRSVVVLLGFAGGIVSLLPAAGDARAGSATDEKASPSYGQDQVCAERCRAVCDICDGKCLSEPPRDAKDKETITECGKKCEIDPKKADQLSPKDRACLRACADKAKPCIRACHVQQGKCLRGCDR